MSQPLHIEAGVRIYCGDCRIVMPELPDCSVDSIVTDPPYELGFMGKGWDRSGIAYDVSVWIECLRVLKPGGHLLAFGGSRTYHRLACAIEDAGFEIRDQIQWIYGSGFPKSLDVSKAIDLARRRNFVLVALEMGIALPERSVDDWTKENHSPGNRWWQEFKAVLPPDKWEEIERRVVGTSITGASGWFVAGQGNVTAPATDAAKQWEGWGTALKPAHEPIVLARKPLIGTVAQNILEHGTGGLNIAATRIKPETLPPAASAYTPQSQSGALVDTSAYVLPRLQDEIQRIASALRSCSTGGIFRSRDAGALDGSLLVVECDSPQTRLYPNGVWCGLNLTLTQDSQGGCQPCRRSCDALFHRAQESAQESPASLADALVDICQGLPELARSRDCQSTDRPSSCDVLTLVSTFVSQLSGNTIPYIQPARWPSNVIHDGSEEVLAGFPESTSPATYLRKTAGFSTGNSGIKTIGETAGKESLNFGDSGSAARFFYCAKASKEDREEGLELLAHRSAGDVTDRKDGSDGLSSPRAGAGRTNGSRNHHPTVKPVDLMRYLVRLITPPGGTVLDPFCGSGSTGKACALEQFKAILIDKELEYCELAARRSRLAQGLLVWEVAN